MVAMRTATAPYFAPSDVLALILQVPECQRESLLCCFERGLERAHRDYQYSDLEDADGMLARLVYVQLMTLALQFAVKALVPPKAAPVLMAAD